MRRFPKKKKKKKRRRELDWPSYKHEDSTFYFVRNHFESIGKQILSKGGEVIMVNEMLKMIKC